MKNIFKIFSLENLKQKLKVIWDRFPVSVVIVFLTSILFFIELHYRINISNFLNERIFIAILSLIMTFIFSIATYLSTENFSKAKLQRNLFQLVPIIFGIIFYSIFSLDPNDFENFLFFILSFTGIIAYLFFAPYLKNIILPLLGRRGLGGGPKQSVYYTYFYNISTTILISFIFAGVLFGLGAIGIAATDALFDLDIAGEKTYGNWAILSLAVIAPLFALAQIPDKKSFRKNYFNENAFFSFLIKFVAIPFIYLYFFILYAYTIKVLSNFSQWPRGEVSWLVIGFSTFGYLTYIFSYIFEEKNKLIKNFRKIFPYAVIPQVFMLFYAIYLRINQYDITVNRYFVVVFGLCLLAISLHFIFSKKKNLIAIPAGLALFIIAISIVPKYNVYTLPENRQLARLETNLKKAGILKDSETSSEGQRITPLKNYSDISKDLSKNIYSGIDYLCDFDSCKNIKNLFPKIYTEILKKDKAQWERNIFKQIEQIEKNKDKKQCDYNKYSYPKNYDCYDKKRLEKLKKETYDGPNKWKIINGITEKIKVKNYFYDNENNKKYFEFSKNYKQDIFPIKIKGYSKIYRITNHNELEKRENYAEYNASKQEITIKEDNKQIANFSTKEISKILLEKFEKNDNRELDKNDLIFELENGKYKLYFENITILNPDYKEWDKTEDIRFFGTYTNGYLLIK